MRHNFINLTNGLDWMDELCDYSFIRIESTAIEHDDWARIFRDLDANFLMHLALGHDCHVYDCGTNRENSKTISVGIPTIRTMLWKYWYETEPIHAPTKELQDLKRKLMYFKRYAWANEIRLTGHSKLTTHDGDKKYWLKIASGGQAWDKIQRRL